MMEEWIMQHTSPGRFIQVQELIRCKDCKYHFEDEGDLWCWGLGWPSRLVQEEGFCNKGEKEEKS